MERHCTGNLRAGVPDPALLLVGVVPLGKSLHSLSLRYSVSRGFRTSERQSSKGVCQHVLPGFTSGPPFTL